MGIRQPSQASVGMKDEGFVSGLFSQAISLEVVSVPKSLNQQSNLYRSNESLIDLWTQYSSYEPNPQWTNTPKGIALWALYKNGKCMVYTSSQDSDT